MPPGTAPLDVVAVGELNPDLIFADFDGQEPRYGTEALARTFVPTLGSSTAICTVGLARLGLAAALVARVGDDLFGTFCRDALQRACVDTSAVRVDRTGPTGVTVSLTLPSDRLLVTHAGSMARTRGSDVPDELLARARHLHAASVFLQPNLLADLPRLFERARDAGLTTSLDTGWDPAGAWNPRLLQALLPNVDVFLPNRDELVAMSGRPDVDDAVAWAMNHGVGCLALKLGAEGARARWADGTHHHHPGFAVGEVDTTGAGDSFDAGFLYATLCDMPARDRLILANACGALATTGVGGTAGFTTRDQVLRFLASEGSPLSSFGPDGSTAS